MNRSKFYFLFSFLAIGGFLLLGFMYPLNAEANVCVQVGQNDNSSTAVELGTGWQCAPDGGGESPWAAFNQSRSIEAANIGFYPACIKIGQNDNNDNVIESETGWVCATDSAESGWVTYTDSRSIEAVKVKNNASGGEVCVKAGQNDNNDNVIESETGWVCAGAGGESPWAFFNNSRSLEAAKIKFTPPPPPTQTGNVYVTVKKDGAEVPPTPDTVSVSGSFSGPNNYSQSFSSLPKWYDKAIPQQVAGQYFFSHLSGGPAGYTFDGIECNPLSCILAANGTLTAYYKFKTSAPANGSIRIKRIDGSGNLMAGTKGNVDASVTSDCTPGVNCDANPAIWDGFVTPGGHGANATDLSGFTETVGICTGSNCNPSSFSAPNGGCSSGNCNQGISVTAGQITTAVFKYTVAPQPKYRCGGPSCIRDDVNGTFTDPSCNNQCAPATGTIEVRGIVNNVEQPFNVNYAVNGPSPANGTSVPATFANRTTGAYALSGISSFPGDFIFDSWDCAPSNCVLNAGQTLFLRMRFHTGSTNQLPVGVHDTNDNTSCNAQGWTTDPDDRNTDLTVKIYSDGSLVKTDTASGFRPDLQSAGVCPGGTCAFVTSLAGLVSTGVSHSIAVRALDTQTGQEQSLGGTPKSITCAATAVNGACGSANGVPSASLPASGLCSTGTPTSVTDSGIFWAWSCQGSNGGSAASCSAPKTVTATCDTSYPNGTFHACYFEGTNPPAGASPVLAQNNESTIDHDWGFGQVNATGKLDQVSGIWRGRINFAAGTYVFHTLSDDGVVLNLEGSGDIITNWNDHGLTQNDSSPITLPAGSRNVTLKWYENGGGARVRLWWETTGVSANNAACSGITAPNTVTPGQSFNATVTMQNTGTKIWTTDSTPHRLGSQNPQDNTLWRGGRVALPHDVPSNANVTFNFSSTAPSTPGNYRFDWKMVEDGVEWFGQTCTKMIGVSRDGGCPSGQSSPHSECVSNACTAVNACGVSTCSSSSQCGGGGGGGGGGCPEAPASITPADGQAVTVTSDPAFITLSWAATANTAFYNVRLDDGTSERYHNSAWTSEVCNGSTAASPYYVCENGIFATSLAGVQVHPGKTYRYWVDPVATSPACSYVNRGGSFSVVRAAVPPNPPTSFDASAGPACNVVNFFWTDANSPPADSSTISCNAGAITIPGLTGSSYTFTGAQGDTSHACEIAAVRSGLSSSARPLDTGPVQTPQCPDFGLNYFGELAAVLTTAGSPKNTNTVTIEVTNAGTSFSGEVDLSMTSVSGAASVFTVVPHFGDTTLVPGETTTLYVTVSGAQPAGIYRGFANVKGFAPALGTEHIIAIPLKVEVKRLRIKEI